MPAKKPPHPLEVRGITATDLHVTVDADGDMVFTTVRYTRRNGKPFYRKMATVTVAPVTARSIARYLSRHAE